MSQNQIGSRDGIDGIDVNSTNSNQLPLLPPSHSCCSPSPFYFPFLKHIVEPTDCTAAFRVTEQLPA